MGIVVLSRLSDQNQKPTPSPQPSPPRGRGGKGADLHAFQDPSSARYLKLTRGKGSRSSCFSRSEFGSISQAGEGEREQIFMLFKIRVRLDISSWRGGTGADLHAFQDPSSARYLKLARGKGSRSSCFSRSEFGSISQAGEGEREQIFMLFKIRVRLDISSWRGGKGADLHAFQDPSSARYLKLARRKGADLHAFQDPSSARYLKLARGKGADHHAFQCRSSTQDVQVGVPRTSTSVSPLSLWERARVRGFLFFSF